MTQDETWNRYFDEDWLGPAREAALAPDIPITDPHHHLMSWPFRYEVGEMVAELANGHKVEATIHVEAHGHYRTEGPEHLRPVGETEYLVNAAQQVERSACSTNICAGIVGYVDVRRGGGVEEVLKAHIQAAQGRFRGIRANLYWNMPRDNSPWTPSAVRSLLEEPSVCAAFACLPRHHLSCDLVAFHGNLPDVCRTAQAFEGTTFIVNHLGGPMTPDPHPDEQALARVWRNHIDDLARRPNVCMKLGGWLNPMLSRSVASVAALRSLPTSPSSTQIADALRPYVEYCIERFGAGRCMFESNFPVDKNFTRYVTLWNAFKRLAGKYSRDEQLALLGGTAARTYRIH